MSSASSRSRGFSGRSAPGRANVATAVHASAALIDAARTANSTADPMMQKVVAEFVARPILQQQQPTGSGGGGASGTSSSERGAQGGTSCLSPLYTLFPYGISPNPVSKDAAMERSSVMLHTIPDLSMLFVGSPIREPSVTVMPFPVHACDATSIPSTSLLKDRAKIQAKLMALLQQDPAFAVQQKTTTATTAMGGSGAAAASGGVVSGSPSSPMSMLMMMESAEEMLASCPPAMLNPSWVSSYFSSYGPPSPELVDAAQELSVSSMRYSSARPASYQRGMFSPVLTLFSKHVKGLSVERPLEVEMAHQLLTTLLHSDFCELATKVAYVSNVIDSFLRRLVLADVARSVGGGGGGGNLANNNSNSMSGSIGGGSRSAAASAAAAAGASGGDGSEVSHQFALQATAFTDLWAQVLVEAAMSDALVEARANLAGAAVSTFLEVVEPSHHHLTAQHHQYHQMNALPLRRSNQRVLISMLQLDAVIRFAPAAVEGKVHHIIARLSGPLSSSGHSSRVLRELAAVVLRDVLEFAFRADADQQQQQQGNNYQSVGSGGVGNNNSLSRKPMSPTHGSEFTTIFPSTPFGGAGGKDQNNNTNHNNNAQHHQTQDQLLIANELENLVRCCRLNVTTGSDGHAHGGAVALRVIYSQCVKHRPGYVLRFFPRTEINELMQAITKPLSPNTPLRASALLLLPVIAAADPKAFIVYSDACHFSMWQFAIASTTAYADAALAASVACEILIVLDTKELLRNQPPPPMTSSSSKPATTTTTGSFLSRNEQQQQQQQQQSASSSATSSERSGSKMLLTRDQVGQLLQTLCKSSMREALASKVTTTISPVMRYAPHWCALSLAARLPEDSFPLQLLQVLVEDTAEMAKSARVAAQIQDMHLDALADILIASNSIWTREREQQQQLQSVAGAGAANDVGLFTISHSNLPTSPSAAAPTSGGGTAAAAGRTGSPAGGGPNGVAAPNSSNGAAPAHSAVFGNRFNRLKIAVERILLRHVGVLFSHLGAAAAAAARASAAAGGGNGGRQRASSAGRGGGEQRSSDEVGLSYYQQQQETRRSNNDDDDFDTQSVGGFSQSSRKYSAAAAAAANRGDSALTSRAGPGGGAAAGRGGGGGGAAAAVRPRNSSEYVLAQWSVWAASNTRLKWAAFEILAKVDWTDAAVALTIFNSYGANFLLSNCDVTLRRAAMHALSCVLQRAIRQLDMESRLQPGSGAGTFAAATVPTIPQGSAKLTLTGQFTRLCNVLLSATVSDLAPDVRYNALALLTLHVFETPLASGTAIETVTTALRDVCLPNRLAGTMLLSRICRFCPGALVPSMLRRMTNILVELRTARVMVLGVLEEHLSSMLQIARSITHLPGAMFASLLWLVSQIFANKDVVSTVALVLGLDLLAELGNSFADNEKLTVWSRCIPEILPLVRTDAPMRLLCAAVRTLSIIFRAVKGPVENAVSVFGDEASGLLVTTLQKILELPHEEGDSVSEELKTSVLQLLSVFELRVTVRQFWGPSSLVQQQREIDEAIAIEMKTITASVGTTGDDASIYQSLMYGFGTSATMAAQLSSASVINPEALAEATCNEQARADSMMELALSEGRAYHRGHWADRILRELQSMLVMSVCPSHDTAILAARAIAQILTGSADDESKKKGVNAGGDASSGRGGDARSTGSHDQQRFPSPFDYHSSTTAGGGGGGAGGGGAGSLMHYLPSREYHFKTFALNLMQRARQSGPAQSAVLLVILGEVAESSDAESINHLLSDDTVEALLQLWTRRASSTDSRIIMHPLAHMFSQVAQAYIRSGRPAQVFAERSAMLAAEMLEEAAAMALGTTAQAQQAAIALLDCVNNALSLAQRFVTGVMLPRLLHILSLVDAPVEVRAKAANVLVCRCEDQPTSLDGFVVSLVTSCIRILTPKRSTVSSGMSQQASAAVHQKHNLSAKVPSQQSAAQKQKQQQSAAAAAAAASSSSGSVIDVSRFFELSLHTLLDCPIEFAAGVRWNPLEAECFALLCSLVKRRRYTAVRVSTLIPNVRAVLYERFVLHAGAGPRNSKLLEFFDRCCCGEYDGEMIDGARIHGTPEAMPLRSSEGASFSSSGNQQQQHHHHQQHAGTAAAAASTSGGADDKGNAGVEEDLEFADSPPIQHNAGYKRMFSLEDLRAAEGGSGDYTITTTAAAAATTSDPKLHPRYFNPYTSDTLSAKAVPIPRNMIHPVTRDIRTPLVTAQRGPLSVPYTTSPPALSSGPSTAVPQVRPTPQRYSLRFRRFGSSGGIMIGAAGGDISGASSEHASLSNSPTSNSLSLPPPLSGSGGGGGALGGSLPSLRLPAALQRNLSTADQARRVSLRSVGEDSCFESALAGPAKTPPLGPSAAHQHAYVVGESGTVAYGAAHHLHHSHSHAAPPPTASAPSSLSSHLPRARNTTALQNVAIQRPRSISDWFEMLHVPPSNWQEWLGRCCDGFVELSKHPDLQACQTVIRHSVQTQRTMFPLAFAAGLMAMQPEQVADVLQELHDIVFMTAATDNHHHHRQSSTTGGGARGHSNSKATGAAGGGMDVGGPYETANSGVSESGASSATMTPSAVVVMQRTASASRRHLSQQHHHDALQSPLLAAVGRSLGSSAPSPNSITSGRFPSTASGSTNTPGGITNNSSSFISAAGRGTSVISSMPPKVATAVALAAHMAHCCRRQIPGHPDSTSTTLNAHLMVSLCKQANLIPLAIHYSEYIATERIPKPAISPPPGTLLVPDPVSFSVPCVGDATERVSILGELAASYRMLYLPVPHDVLVELRSSVELIATQATSARQLVHVINALANADDIRAALNVTARGAQSLFSQPLPHRRGAALANDKDSGSQLDPRDKARLVAPLAPAIAHLLNENCDFEFALNFCTDLVEALRTTPAAANTNTAPPSLSTSSAIAPGVRGPSSPVFSRGGGGAGVGVTGTGRGRVAPNIVRGHHKQNSDVGAESSGVGNGGESSPSPVAPAAAAAAAATAIPLADAFRILSSFATSSTQKQQLGFEVARSTVCMGRWDLSERVLDHMPRSYAYRHWVGACCAVSAGDYAAMRREIVAGRRRILQSSHLLSSDVPRRAFWTGVVLQGLSEIEHGVAAITSAEPVARAELTRSLRRRGFSDTASLAETCQCIAMRTLFSPIPDQYEMLLRFGRNLCMSGDGGRFIGLVAPLVLSSLWHLGKTICKLSSGSICFQLHETLTGGTDGSGSAGRSGPVYYLNRSVFAGAVNPLGRAGSSSGQTTMAAHSAPNGGGGGAPAASGGVELQDHDEVRTAQLLSMFSQTLLVVEPVDTACEVLVHLEETLGAAHSRIASEVNPQRGMPLYDLSLLLGRLRVQLLHSVSNVQRREFARTGEDWRIVTSMQSDATAANLVGSPTVFAAGMSAASSVGIWSSYALSLYRMSLALQAAGDQVRGSKIDETEAECRMAVVKALAMGSNVPIPQQKMAGGGKAGSVTPTAASSTDSASTVAGGAAAAAEERRVSSPGGAAAANNTSAASATSSPSCFSPSPAAVPAAATAAAGSSSSTAASGAIGGDNFFIGIGVATEDSSSLLSRMGSGASRDFLRECTLLLVLLELWAPGRNVAELFATVPHAKWFAVMPMLLSGYQSRRSPAYAAILSQLLRQHFDIVGPDVVALMPTMEHTNYLMSQSATATGRCSPMVTSPTNFASSTVNPMIPHLFTSAASTVEFDALSSGNTSFAAVPTMPTPTERQSAQQQQQQAPDHVDDVFEMMYSHPETAAVAENVKAFFRLARPSQSYGEIALRHARAVAPFSWLVGQRGFAMAVQQLQLVAMLKGPSASSGAGGGSCSATDMASSSSPSSSLSCSPCHVQAVHTSPHVTRNDLAFSAIGSATSSNNGGAGDAGAVNDVHHLSFGYSNCKDESPGDSPELRAARPSIVSRDSSDVGQQPVHLVKIITPASTTPDNSNLDVAQQQRRHQQQSRMQRQQQQQQQQQQQSHEAFLHSPLEGQTCHGMSTSSGDIFSSAHAASGSAAAAMPQQGSNFFAPEEHMASHVFTLVMHSGELLPFEISLDDPMADFEQAPRLGMVLDMCASMLSAVSGAGVLHSSPLVTCPTFALPRDGVVLTHEEKRYHRQKLKAAATAGNRRRSLETVPEDDEHPLPQPPPLLHREGSTMSVSDAEDQGSSTMLPPPTLLQVRPRRRRHYRLSALVSSAITIVDQGITGGTKFSGGFAPHTLSSALADAAECWDMSDAEQRTKVLARVWEQHPTLSRCLANSMLHSMQDPATWLRARSQYSEHLAGWGAVSHVACLNTRSLGAFALCPDTGSVVMSGRLTARLPNWSCALVPAPSSGSYHSNSSNNNKLQQLCYIKTDPTPFRLSKALVRAMDASSASGVFAHTLTASLAQLSQSAEMMSIYANLALASAMSVKNRAAMKYAGATAAPSTAASSAAAHNDAASTLSSSHPLTDLDKHGNTVIRTLQHEICQRILQVPQLQQYRYPNPSILVPRVFEQQQQQQQHKSRSTSRGNSPAALVQVMMDPATLSELGNSHNNLVTVPSAGSVQAMMNGSSSGNGAGNSSTGGGGGGGGGERLSPVPERPASASVALLGALGSTSHVVLRTATTTTATPAQQLFGAGARRDSSPIPIGEVTPPNQQRSPVFPVPGGGGAQFPSARTAAAAPAMSASGGSGGNGTRSTPLSLHNSFALSDPSSPDAARAAGAGGDQFPLTPEGGSGKRGQQRPTSVAAAAGIANLRTDLLSVLVSPSYECLDDVASLDDNNSASNHTGSVASQKQSSQALEAAVQMLQRDRTASRNASAIKIQRRVRKFLHKRSHCLGGRCVSAQAMAFSLIRAAKATDRVVRHNFDWFVFA